MNKLDKNIKYPHFHRNIFIIETKVLFLMLIEMMAIAEVLKLFSTMNYSTTGWSFGEECI